MIRRLLWMMLCGSLLLRAGDVSEKRTCEGIAEFNAAYQAWDGGRFGAAAEIFRQAATAAPGSAVNFHWQGAALFHRMLQLRDHDAKAAHTAMEAAITVLETAVTLDGHHAESHALLGTLYGMKINGGMLRAIRFGPAVQEHQRQALQWGPQNPRVRYLLGTGLFHTAKDEASRREALKTLLAAESLFAAEAKRLPAPFEPRWGRSSCLTFIGRSYAMLGRPTEAAEYFRKALAEHPADHVARNGLARISTAN